jgi:O-antigen ligase
MNDEVEESNITNVTSYDNEDMLSYPGLELDDYPSGGRFVFIVVVMFLASHFYAIPFIKTPWGYTTYMRLDDIMAAVLFLFVIFGAKNNYPTMKTKTGKLLGFVAIAMIVSFLYGRFFSAISLKTELYAVWQTVRYINYIVVFFLVARVIYNPKRLVILMWVVFFGGLFVALYGLGQYYGYISAYYLAEVFKESGPWAAIAEAGEFREVLGPLSKNHSYCGMMLGTTLSFAWALFSGRAVFSKLILLGGGAVIFYAMILTGARAPIYALPVAVMANMVFLKGRVKHALLMALAAILFFAVLNLSQFYEFQERFFLQEGFTTSSGAARVQALLRAVGWFAHNPLALLTGVGVGNWWAVALQQTGLVAGHNNYLHYLVEGGILGLTLFVIGLWMAVKHAYQLSKFPMLEISKWGQAMFTVVVFWSISALAQENFVPSAAFGSILSLFLFLMAVTTWAKQYVDERSSILTEAEYKFVEPPVPIGECC